MARSVTARHLRVTSVVAMVVLSAGVVSLAQTANAGVTKCQAQNITLGTKESPNLQALINAASPGNTIQVKGVCVGPFTISKNLTVFGKPTKAVPHPALDGGYNATTNPSPGPVVRVGAGTTVAIRDLTIQHGAYPCTDTNQALECDTGGVFNAGALTLTRIIVADNVGSGIGNYEVSGAASLSLTDSLVTDNHCQFHGGGILTVSGTVTLTRTIVTNNRADLDAGGISVAFGAVSVTLDDSEVSHNTAGDQGGAIWNGAHLIVNGTTTIDHNTATTDGGAIFNFKGSFGEPFTFDGHVDLNGASEVRDNTAARSGGGVYNTGAVSLNDDATVHGNTATSGTGGGIFNDCTAGVLVGATTTNVHDNTPDQLNNCIG
jgi:predicted outer membrane repeat protein